MEFRDKVKKVLEEIELPGLEVEIESEEYGRVVAEVLSPAFETMDELRPARSCLGEDSREARRPGAKTRRVRPHHRTVGKSGGCEGLNDWA